MSGQDLRARGSPCLDYGESTTLTVPPCKAAAMSWIITEHLSRVILTSTGRHVAPLDRTTVERDQRVFVYLATLADAGAASSGSIDGRARDRVNDASCAISYAAVGIEMPCVGACPTGAWVSSIVMCVARLNANLRAPRCTQPGTNGIRPPPTRSHATCCCASITGAAQNGGSRRRGIRTVVHRSRYREQHRPCGR
jgi:hypothetical protein